MKSLFTFDMPFLWSLYIYHSKETKELVWSEYQFNSVIVMEDWSIFSCGMSFTHKGSETYMEN